MVSRLPVTGQFSGKEYLTAELLYVHACDTGDIAEGVEKDRPYALHVRLTNSYAPSTRPNSPDYHWEEKYWYYNISLRVCAETKGIEIYEDASFNVSTILRGNRKDIWINLIPCGRGIENPKLFDVYFKWKGSGQEDINNLKFTLGLYAQEVQRSQNWGTLSVAYPTP